MLSGTLCTEEVVQLYLVPRAVTTVILQRPLGLVDIQCPTVGPTRTPVTYACVINAIALANSTRFFERDIESGDH